MYCIKVQYISVREELDASLALPPTLPSSLLLFVSLSLSLSLLFIILQRSWIL